MTLGEKIQQLRKERGLSQEELAEQLFVSRQAVSKWESGGAIPEVEKLIELSKLFSVSLDTLLQTGNENEELTETQTQVEFPDSFSDKQLGAISEIVGAHAPKKIPKKWMLIGGTAIAVAILIAVCTILKQTDEIRYLKNELTNVRNQMGSMESSLRMQIYNLTNELESLLKEQGSLLSAHEITQETVSPDEMRLILRATPKELTEGTTATFVLTGLGAEPVRLTAELDGTTYFAVHSFTPPEVSTQSTVDVSVIFDNGESKQTEFLPQQRIYNAALLNVYTTGGPSFSKLQMPDAPIELRGDIQVYVGSSARLANDKIPLNLPKEANLYLEIIRDGEIAWEKKIPFPLDKAHQLGGGVSAPVVTIESSSATEIVEAVPDIWRSETTEGFSLSLKGEVPVRALDRFRIRAVVTDLFGYEYEVVPFECTIEENGGIGDKVRPYEKNPIIRKP